MKALISQRNCKLRIAHTGMILGLLLTELMLPASVGQEQKQLIPPLTGNKYDLIGSN